METKTAPSYASHLQQAHAHAPPRGWVDEAGLSCTPSDEPLALTEAAADAADEPGGFEATVFATIGLTVTVTLLLPRSTCLAGTAGAASFAGDAEGLEGDAAGADGAALALDNAAAFELVGRESSSS